MKIEIDDLTRPEIHALLNEHLQSMYELSPPESVHALDLEQLRKPDITFWSAWEGPLLLGCGALKKLDATHGEVKSMRTAVAVRRQGVARAILAHIIEVARHRSYERLSLETGCMEAFKPAQKLYESFGFLYCGPFGEYPDDPNSVFMTMSLRDFAPAERDVYDYERTPKGSHFGAPPSKVDCELPNLFDGVIPKPKLVLRRKDYEG